ncbi:peptidyl-prolyl cis-trans isomerase D [Cognatiyoonia koreensis]|uniref:Parvulin-like PPIase n=1 Tax=Cognatiyoonia koreensis TaxID=364200 RepID=A0A1I0PK47_9RHOB|nr:peptidyl-prolyl cis-trans isomerase [Cognatiyoonia koreensis]SEW14673.1 peptidyl-prolyl cis-trans isomerase D [Cognatiyoonia koreensis]
MAEKKQGNRYFVWIIMALLFVGLLGFGTGGLSGNLRSIGTVGEKEISIAQYQSALNQQIRAFEAQIQQPIPFQQAQQFGIDQQVRSQIVTERTLDNETSQLGISVGDDRVREEVLRIPAFRGLDGSFDREAYRSALQRSGQTEAMFETAIREEVARTLLQGAVVGGVPAPDAYADALVKFVSEQRTVTWAAVDSDDLSVPLPGPTADDLQTYYSENPEAFTAPERREITFAWMTPDMIQDGIVVSEDELRQAYDARADQYIRPERRLVERLVFSDAETANAAMTRIQAGEATFEDLVSEMGFSLSDTDLGDVSQDDLGAAGEAIFAAQPTDVVGPLDSEFGPAIFRMNAVLAAQETSFEDAAPDLQEELSADRARRQIETVAENINDLLAGGATLENLAETTDMELGTISFDENSSEGIAAYDSFRAVAATVTEGAFPELEQLEDGGIFALRLGSVTPPTVRPFDDVEDAVARAWNQQTERDAVLARAEELAASITADSNMNDAGLLAIAEPPLTRRSFVEGTPPSFMTEVFEMDTGEVKVIPSVNNVLIVRLESISQPSPDDPQTAAEREALGQSGAAGIAQDIFAAFADALQARTEVNIDQAAVNAVHASFQ